MPEIPPCALHEPIPVVYLAGPITKPDPLTNASVAMVIWRHIMLHCRCCLICPHWSVLQHMASPQPNAFWYQYDSHLVAISHAVYRLPGHSVGADYEQDVALQKGVPVFGEDGPCRQAGEFQREPGYRAGALWYPVSTKTMQRVVAFFPLTDVLSVFQAWCKSDLWMARWPDYNTVKEVLGGVDRNIGSHAIRGKSVGGGPQPDAIQEWADGRSCDWYVPRDAGEASPADDQQQD